MIKVHCSLKEWVNLVLNAARSNDNSHSLTIKGYIVEVEHNGKKQQFVWAYA